jgi:hypothetical protein
MAVYSKIEIIYKRAECERWGEGGGEAKRLKMYFCADVVKADAER